MNPLKEADITAHFVIRLRKKDVASYDLEDVMPWLLEVLERRGSAPSALREVREEIIRRMSRV